MWSNLTKHKEQDEHARIRQEINERLTDESGSRSPGSEQLQSRIFNFLDSELGQKCTLEEARNYVKLIKQLGKKHLLARQYTDVLLKKANRFLDKKSYNKEKQEIKQQYRDMAIINFGEAS
jgi:hypothetical protein